jgi:hypothetical protein
VIAWVKAGLALALVLSAGGAGAGEPKTAPDTKAAAAKSATTKSSKAKPAADASKKALPAARLDAARAALAGEDDAAAIAAIESLGGSGAGNAAEPLVEMLAAGAAPARTEAALDALAKLGAGGALTAARAFEVLELYCGHRAPEVRQRAIKALGTIRDPRVVAILLARLGDAAPGVRGAAGEALAARKERAGVPRLFALVKRGDAGAASPLAALATPDLIPQVAELTGTVDEGVLAIVLGDYVQRADVPDRLRLDVVRTIAGLGGAAATAALVEYVASVPAKDDRPSKREAQKLLDTREAAR